MEEYVKMQQCLEMMGDMDPALRKYIIVKLLIDGKMLYEEISQAYVDYLEHKATDTLNMLVEAESCALTGIIGDRKPAKEKTKRNSQLRTLYLLNQSKRYQMQKLNERLEYDEDAGKELSWYEKQKNND